MNDEYQTMGGVSDWDDDSPDKLTPGTVLGGDYELVRQLGRGGMGVVWEAKELAADRLVALKFVPRDLQRFETEMQRVRQTFTKIHALQHQHICPVYGLKNDPQLGYYLVMKWLTGVSLDAYLMRLAQENKPITPQQALAVLKPVATALDYAHTQKIIHRDIKPSNIFLVLDEAGDIRDVQVIDFGLAGEIKATMSRISQAMTDTSGTRPYMAPEQWRGRQQSAATDQYALAVVAYEMLSGHLPFEGGDLELLRMAVMQDKPEPIRTIPPNANAVLQKGLAKDAADRYADCATLINTLASGFGVGQPQAQPHAQPQAPPRPIPQPQRPQPENPFPPGYNPYQQGTVNHPYSAKPVGTGSRSKVVAGILALLLGTWGAHKFYHRSWGWGIVYVSVSLFICFLLFVAIGLMAGSYSEGYRLGSEAAYEEGYYGEDADAVTESFAKYYVENSEDYGIGAFVLVFVFFFMGPPYCILILVETIRYWCMEDYNYNTKYNMTPPHPFKW